MALAQYSRQFWYPDASPAVNLPVQIFPYDQNLFSPIFADAAGTIPLPNPGTSTDGTGTLTFYAQPGQIWVHLDTETFLDDVGVSEESADLSTGVAWGGDISPDLGNPQAVTIDEFLGFIVDFNDPSPLPPTVTRVHFAAQTVALDAGALGRTITYWLVDGTGAVIQQATRPTPEQRRQLIVIGVSFYDTNLGVVVEAQTRPIILHQPGPQMVDLMESLGPFSINGNQLSGIPGTMQIAKTAGQIFARGFTYVLAGAYTDNPHISDTPAASPSILRRITQVSAVPTPPPVLTIDAANYDVGGAIVPVPGGPNVATVQRVYLFASDTPSIRIGVQYGQTTYATLQTAVASIGSGNQFNPAPVTVLGALIGYIAVIRSATDLSDPAQATFVYAGKFSTP